MKGWRRRFAINAKARGRGCQELLVLRLIVFWVFWLRLLSKLILIE
ncbi:MAG: hypothetical protein ACKESB_00335 [Candidatus Hodgkinia cicadicola]